MSICGSALRVRNSVFIPSPKVEESVVRSSEKSVADLTIKELKEELIATGKACTPLQK